MSEDINLPELNFSAEMAEKYPEADPARFLDKDIMAALIEVPERNVTIVSEHAVSPESKNQFAVVLHLPVAPNLVKGLLNFPNPHKNIEAYQSGSDVTLISSERWDTAALSDMHRFNSLRNEAEAILRPIYTELVGTLRTIESPYPVSFELARGGLRAFIAGVDISQIYSPFNLVSKQIAAEAIGEKLTLNVETIKDGAQAVFPEISGTITYEQMCEAFNNKLRALQPKMFQFDLFTAFVGRSTEHEGLDIVSVKPNGEGGYVNLSKELSLYMFGKNKFVPVFKREGDMLMVSTEDLNVFDAADVAQWINFASWITEDETFKS